MNIRYVADSQEDEFSRAYLIMDDDEWIGSVEGYLNQEGVLVSVVKLFSSLYRGKGIGFEAFRKVVDELNVVCPVQKIVGSWHQDEEFQYFEDGKSTNLKLFQEGIRNGLDENESAFQTPTGKWARKLGFTKCKVVSKSNDSVTVYFER